MRRVQTRRLATLAIVLVLASAGCGAKSNAGKEAAGDAADAAASGAPSTTAAGDQAGFGDDPSASASAKADVKTGSGDAKTPAASDSGTGEAAAPADEPPPLDTKIFENDFVFGKPQARNTDDPRPPNCEFKTGELCRFNVAGTYGLKSAEAASIHVGAYENGSSEAAFHTSLPNAKKGSSRWFIKEFPYQARPGITTVDFIIKLLDLNGKELARSAPSHFEISKS